MRIFSRGDEPPPAYLTGAEAQRARQSLAELFIASAERRAQTRIEGEYLDLNSSDLQQSLARLFRGKCAFCESRRETMPYRFRPPFEATPTKGRRNAHLFYAWLADAWENLFPICEDCQPDDRLYFPVAGARVALPTGLQVQRYADENLGLWRRFPLKEANQLLDPTNELSLARHFHVTAHGVFFSRSKRGEATLRHFRLDRDELTRERAAAFSTYLTNLAEWIASPGPPVRGGQNLFDFAHMAFGGGWYLLLRRILEVYLAREPSSYPLTEPQIRSHFVRLAAKPDASIAFNDFLNALDAQDEHLLRSRRGSSPQRVGEARLTKVSITNFKGLEHLEFELAPTAPTVEEAPAPSLLFLGENAAGKSTLLEAMALTLVSEEARNQLGLEVDDLRLNPRFMGADKGSPADIAKIVLSFADGDEHALLIDRQFRTSGRRDLPPVFAYGAFRQFRGRAKNYSASRAIVTLFHADVLIGNPEPWLMKLNEDDFEEVARTLRVLLSGEEDFDAIRKKDGGIVVMTYLPQSNGELREASTPLALVSSGFRSVIAMACDIFRGLMDKRVYPGFKSLRTAAPVILIDEVEAHLHPRWKLQIMGALRRALPRATIIATSHDPLCLRGMGDGEVAVLHRISGAESDKTRLPVLIEKLEDLPDVTQLTVEQILTSNVFGMFSTDAPATEASFALMGELLARRRAREIWNGDGAPPMALTEAEDAMVTRFAADIAASLPVGTTPAQSLVEDAVAEYLSKRREETSEKIAKLRDKAKAKIIEALGRL